VLVEKLSAQLCVSFSRLDSWYQKVEELRNLIKASAVLVGGCSKLLLVRNSELRE